MKTRRFLYVKDSIKNDGSYIRQEKVLILSFILIFAYSLIVSHEYEKQSNNFESQL